MAGPGAVHDSKARRPEPPGKGEKPQTEKVIFDFLSGLEMTGTTLPDDVVKWWKEQAAIKKGEVTL